MSEKKKELFYGWIIVAGGFVLLFVGIGIGISSLQVFFKPVVEDLGFKRGDFALYYSIAGIAMMFGAVIVGKLLEKYSIRVVMGVATSMFALAAMLYSRCNTLGQFYLVSVLSGLGMAGTHIIPVTYMINNWFVKKRGLATGIVFTATGVGAMICIPLLSRLVEAYGWRTAFFQLGIIVAVTCVPVALFIAKKSPSDMGLMPDGEPSSDAGEKPAEGLGLSEAVRIPGFWMLAFMVLLFSMANLGINQHLVPYFTDLGYPESTASMMVGAYLGMTVPGKVTLGLLSDRRGVTIGLIIFIAISICGIILLINAKAFAIAVAFIVVCGFGNVMQTVIPPLMTTEFAGLKYYTVIFSVMSVFMTIGSAIGPPLSGYIFDKQGSYHNAFMLYIGIVFLGLLLGLLAMRQARYRRRA